MRALEVLSPHTLMIAALYSARCTLTSEIEVKDNGSGNWLINPEEAKGCLSNTASSCMLFVKSKTSPASLNLTSFQKGGDRAKQLNLPRQARATLSEAAIV